MTFKTLRGAVLVSVLLAPACAPNNNNLLTPAPTVVSPPATTIGVTVSGATSVNVSLLNVAVGDATGKGVLGAMVTLTTTAGALNHPTVTTGQDGTAQVLLTTTDDATVTVRTGDLSASVKAIAYRAPPPPVDSPAPPPPPPPVIVPPALTCANTPSLCPPPQLAVTLTCTANPHGTPSPCNVEVSDGVALPATAITQVVWNWGDGSMDTTLPLTAPIDTHTYANAGSYAVFATVTATTTPASTPVTATKTLVIP